MIFLFVKPPSLIVARGAVALSFVVFIMAVVLVAIATVGW
jgi:hypothetical protein